MERTIVKSNKPMKTIASSEVEQLANNKGIILIYDKENIVGHLTNLDRESWKVELIEDSTEHESISEAMDEYPDLTFKYID